MLLSFSQGIPRSSLIATMFSGVITAGCIAAFSRISCLFSSSIDVAYFEVLIAQASFECPLHQKFDKKNLIVPSKV